MKEPKFHSIQEERQFWETHDAVEVLGKEGVEGNRLVVEVLYEGA